LLTSIRHALFFFIYCQHSRCLE